MIKLIAFLTRLPHVDREAFKTYYETRHVPLVTKLLPPMAGYERNYPDASKVRPPEGLDVDGYVSFDALTIMWFADRDQLNAWKKAMADPEILRRIREDEANFLDASKTRLFMVEAHASAQPAIA